MFRTADHDMVEPKKRPHREASCSFVRIGQGLVKTKSQLPVTDSVRPLLNPGPW